MLLNDGGIPLVNKGDASPLPSWRGDDVDPDNEVDYDDSEDSDLFLLSDSDQAPRKSSALRRCKYSVERRAKC